MFVESFCVAEVTVSLLSDEKIAVSPRFHVFKTDCADSGGVKVSVCRGALYKPSGNLVCRTRTHEYYENGTGVSIVTFYFDRLSEKNVPYAVCERFSEDTWRLIVSDKVGELRDSMIFDAVPYTDILLSKGAPVMHASFSAVDGGALLFTGVSGAGKTTQSLLWERFRCAKTVNGDRAAVRLSVNGTIASGVPFCGSSGVSVNESYPVRAVVFPAKSDGNFAHTLSTREVIKLLPGSFSYMTFSRYYSDLMWKFLESFAEKTKFIRLECTPDERAVETLERILWDRMC